jgi:3-oxoacyl-[acyl-carrier protein] reductase
MFKLDNRVAIITGSGSKRGIGRTIALTLAKQGAAVVIADLNMEGIQDTVQTITEAGGKALGVELNVTSKESTDAMVEKVLQTYGRIDILVNNAGISQKVTVQDMTIEDISRIFNVNMFGLFLCTQSVLETMKNKDMAELSAFPPFQLNEGEEFLEDRIIQLQKLPY